MLIHMIYQVIVSSFKFQIVGDDCLQECHEATAGGWLNTAVISEEMFLFFLYNSCGAVTDLIHGFM